MVDVVKALLFIFLIVECPDHQHAGKLFPCNEVQPVHEFLDQAELRKGQNKGDGHENHNDQQYPAKDICHTFVAHDLE